MANPQPPGDALAGSNPPENPKPSDAWVDDYGDLYTWDGTDWVPFEDIPFFRPNSVIRDA